MGDRPPDTAQAEAGIRSSCSPPSPQRVAGPMDLGDRRRDPNGPEGLRRGFRSTAQGLAWFEVQPVRWTWLGRRRWCAAWKRGVSKIEQLIREALSVLVWSARRSVFGERGRPSPAAPLDPLVCGDVGVDVSGGSRLPAVPEAGRTTTFKSDYNRVRRMPRRTGLQHALC